MTINTLPTISSLQKEIRALRQEIDRIRALNRDLKQTCLTLNSAHDQACEQRDILAIALLKKRLTPNEKDWLQ
jgi:prefoldin subunit 5